MPRVIGSRRRARVTAGSSPVGRKADTEHGRRSLVARGLAAPSTATLLTVVGIGLGASLVFASLAVGRGVERSIERAVEVALGRSDFRVSALDGGTLSEEALVTIRSVFGVEVAAPAVEQRTTLLPEADTTAPSLSPVTIHGIDPILDGQIRDLDLVAGTTITRRDEAAAIITERLAAEDGYGLGSDVIVATPGVPERFRVIGIAAGDGPLAESAGRTVILPIDAVVRIFGLDGVARVDLVVGEGVPLAGVRAELGEALAGEPYVLTSAGDLAESLRLPTTGFAVTATGIAAVGTLVGALLVFGAVRLTARAAGEVRLYSTVRGAVMRGAIGSAVGGVLTTVLAVFTRADVGPAALGLGGMAAAIAIAVLCAVAAGVLPPRRVAPTPARMLVAMATRLSRLAESAMPRSLRAETRIARTELERDPAWTTRTVPVLAIALGLVVAVAMVGANAYRTAAEQSPAPVLVRVVAQIDALGLLAVVVAGLAIVGIVAMGDRERLAGTGVLPAVRPTSGHVGRVILLEAGILGLAGAVLGSITGLGVGAALIVLGGRLDAAVDVPWAALGLCLVLGVGLSMAAAWVPGPPRRPAADRSRGPVRVINSADRRRRGPLPGGEDPMTIAFPRLNRLPAAERGITIADFFVPVRVGESLSSRARHLVLILAGALVIAASAQITIALEGQTIPMIADFRIQLGSSPVPITGQTFGVLLVGGALGFRRGILAVLLYLAMGFVLPVYAGGESGLDVFVSRADGRFVLGPTGGYLVGFVVAAAAAGRLAELGWDRRILGALAAMLLGNVLIYIVGVPWLAFALGVDAQTAVAFGLTPFVIVDLLKLAAAAALFPTAWWVVGRRPGDR